MKLDVPSFIVGYVVGIFALLACLTMFGCSSTPNRQFNAEDKQDGNCYAMFGGLRGYCSAVDMDEIETDCQYDHNSTGSYKVCK